MNTTTLTEQQLIEGLGEDVLKTLRKAGFGTHLFLDIVGVVADLIPGGQPVGITSDVANAILYLVKEPPKYLDAGLSLISAIPGFGDILGKGGKLTKYFSNLAIDGVKGGVELIKKLNKLGIPYASIARRLERARPGLERLLKELGKKHPMFLKAQKFILREIDKFIKWLFSLAVQQIQPEKTKSEEPEQKKTNKVKPVEPEALNEQRNRMLVIAGIPRK